MSIELVAFQSTHPVRGATDDGSDEYKNFQFQSTHPVRGATKRLVKTTSTVEHFNPRTP